MAKPTYEELQRRVQELEKLVDIKISPQDFYFEARDLICFRGYRDWSVDFFDRKIESLTRGGNEAAVLAPLTGVVAAVNAKAARNPSTVKEHPYNQGWLLVLEPENLKDDLGNLLYGTEAQQWLSAEHQGLVEMVSRVGLTYADGGGVDDVFGSVPEISWDELRQRFLRT